MQFISLLICKTYPLEKKTDKYDIIFPLASLTICSKQSSKSCLKTLEGLCRSVLLLAADDLVWVELRNLIEFGTRIKSKEFILDFTVNVNNPVFLNFENADVP